MRYRPQPVAALPQVLPSAHLPLTRADKPQQKVQILGLIHEQQLDLLALTRFMQIQSDNLCLQLKGRAINIHDFFLRGFKSAKPCHQAYDHAG
ncbi:formyltransferase family protein [Marinobacter salarius]|uniref:formyltransferase family protein n=1 Tax=Marinobacter salarius TaxID=1420917 RepID=UPI0032EBAB43